MAFCRGCGKEIDEVATTCPHCGALQGIVPATVPRSVGKLIAFALLWTILFWFASVTLAGMIAGALHPTEADEAGRAAGAAVGGISIFISAGLSAWLTTIGLLPGTRKKPRPGLSRA